ncbi:hypothetical protein FACS1894191_2820 [Clostridia bacterium]|nr:hypothetical protein FACS1894191_2820 [Clostridia bacterium]
MNRSTSALVTTACVGVAMGTAAYMMSGNHAARGRARRIRKTTGKAIRQVGEIIGSVSAMMR